MRTVSQQDVSGKVVERVARCNFANDDSAPDAIAVEKYASELGSSAVYAGRWNRSGTQLVLYMTYSECCSLISLIWDLATLPFSIRTN